MLATFQRTGISAWTVNSSYELRMPTTTPETPMRTTTGKRMRERVSRAPRGRPPKMRMISGEEQEEAGQRAEHDEDEPEEGRRHARLARAAPSSSSLKTGTNAALSASLPRAAHEVGELERDGERVDVALDPERRRATISQRPRTARSR